jgi:hypothetical protein
VSQEHALSLVYRWLLVKPEEEHEEEAAATERTSLLSGGTSAPSILRLSIFTAIAAMSERENAQKGEEQ